MTTSIIAIMSHIALRVVVACFGLSVGLGGCYKKQTYHRADLVEQGRRIAETRCARCHAIDPLEQSLEPSAPPFSRAVSDYDIEALGLDFEAHMQTGTEVMPAFKLTAEELDALIAFILTLEQETYRQTPE